MWRWVLETGLREVPCSDPVLDASCLCLALSLFLAVSPHITWNITAQPFHVPSDLCS
jgi:hypothetical protein